MEKLRSRVQQSFLVAVFSLLTACAKQPNAQNPQIIDLQSHDESTTSEPQCSYGIGLNKNLPLCKDDTDEYPVGTVTVRDITPPSHFSPELKMQIAECQSMSTVTLFDKPDCFRNNQCKPTTSDCASVLNNVTIMVNAFDTCSRVQPDPSTEYTQKDLAILDDNMKLTNEIADAIITTLNNPLNPNFQRCFNTTGRAETIAKISHWKSQNNF